MTKSHFGCEICGKKLNNQSEATQHLLDQREEPQSCVRSTFKRRYEIGIALWMKLLKIYKDKSLDHHRKWLGWWNLLCPGTEEPDPLHYDTISLSTADIPRVQDMVEIMWEDTPSLPALSTEQKGHVANILGKVLQILPRVSRPRRQRRQVQPQGKKAPNAQEKAPQQLQTGSQDQELDNSPHSHLFGSPSDYLNNMENYGDADINFPVLQL